MKPEVAALFGELTGVEPEARARYYAENGVSAEVRDEVESLLAFDDGPPLAGVVRSAVEAAFREQHAEDDRCGPFRLLRLLGRGGMGVVYLAERVGGDVQQTVAVKLLRAGLDTPGARQRFLQERQILARLAHPNIARLIDAGHRADGQPYLAMEYVEGQPIDLYCRERSKREKVALMVTVCGAIGAAHQKLIAHRDLKPGNILVDAEGRPRVLDFGIAKLLDDSEATATIERRLTPDYASPEQMAGGTITTATDIYSLGCVLRRLIAPDEDTDLDAVVLKAMRPEARDRYQTAEKLGEDLMAWLRRRPVIARQEERWYPVRRWFRRYWGLALAGALAAAGLATGLVVARRERDAAQKRFDDVRHLAAEFFRVEKEIRGMPGSLGVREKMVKTSIGYLESLSKRAGDDWALKAEIAEGYRSAAEAQGLSRGPNLGKVREATESLRKAEAMLSEAERLAPGERKVLHDRIELTEMQLRMDEDAKNVKALEARLDELSGLMHEYEAVSGSDPEAWAFLGPIYQSMVLSANELPHRTDLSEGFAKRAVELGRKAAPQGGGMDAQVRLSRALVAYGNHLRVTGDLKAALAAMEEAIRVSEKVAKENPDNGDAQNLAFYTVNAAAHVMDDLHGPSLHRNAESIAMLRRGMEILRRRLAADPKEMRTRMNVSAAGWSLGNALRDHDPEEALRWYGQATEMLRPMEAGRFSRDTLLAVGLTESVFALRKLNRTSEAKARIREANGLCDPYREKEFAVYEDCRGFVSRAEAEMAGPREAAAKHEEWLALIPENKRMEDARASLHNATPLAHRYRLLRDAWQAAGEPAKAEAAAKKMQAVLDLWRGRITGGAVAAVILPRYGAENDDAGSGK